jgi:hypothetical protein
MQIPIKMQVMSKCECHKTLEGLQNCKLRCWKKCQIARGHCGRRDLFFLLLFKSKLLSCELLVVIEFGWGIGFPDWFLASSPKLVPLCFFWFQSGFVSWILFLNSFPLGPPPGVQDLESNEKGNLALASYHLTGQQVTWIRYFVKVQRRQKASKQTGAAALRAIQK